MYEYVQIVTAKYLFFNSALRTYVSDGTIITNTCLNTISKAGIEMKLYMVWDKISDSYFSIVAGVLRQERKDGAYIYDKKHATYILQQTNKIVAEMMKSEKLPAEARQPVDLCLKEVKIDEVPITEDVLDRTWSERIKHGFSINTALRLCKYEQVRRFNDYVTFDPHTLSHNYRYLTEIF